LLDNRGSTVLVLSRDIVTTDGVWNGNRISQQLLDLKLCSDERHLDVFFYFLFDVSRTK
jgi:hypothetical protein